MGTTGVAGARAVACGVQQRWGRRAGGAAAHRDHVGQCLKSRPHFMEQCWRLLGELQPGAVFPSSVFCTSSPFTVRTERTSRKNRRP